MLFEAPLIYDVGNTGDINYIATEYVEGVTIRELIGEKLSLAEILNVIMRICDALAAARNEHIIHRDIKPENIMLRLDGYVKILDFGLAKLSETNSRTENNFTKTAKGIIIGMPAYRSPQPVTDDNVDHLTHLCSLGVVLYELLTGFNPYKKETRQATYQTILTQKPPLASTFNAVVSGELDLILYKVLEKEADVSYQTAADLRADLKRAESVRRRTVAACREAGELLDGVFHRHEESHAFIEIVLGDIDEAFFRRPQAERGRLKISCGITRTYF